MSSSFNSTLYIMLYPQNGDRIATIDSVTSLDLMYTADTRRRRKYTIMTLTYYGYFYSAAQLPAMADAQRARHIPHHLLFPQNHYRSRIKPQFR